MESPKPARVLVVAHRTAATPQLIEAVAERAAAGPATFTLLVPRAAHGLHRFVDPEDTDDSEAQMVLELALPLLEEAVGGHVEAKIGDPNPNDAIHDAMNIDGYDEIIISTLPARVSRWLHADLPSKLKPLGVPITTVIAKSSRVADDA
jgi:formylmethanofuran:tetrahydromethanopterin formyltransferase